MLSSRNLKSGMLSVYRISITVFVGDFDDDVSDGAAAADVSNVVSDVRSSVDASFLARATAKRMRPCRTLAQWFCVLRTLG
jgi:hypothetical protein